MADLKISQLTGATTPLAGTEVLPIVQSGATKQVSVANLTAGRTQTSNGIVQGSAATGYNFTANTPAAGMTSQLLNWYEEGTWTGGSFTLGNCSSASLSQATYTRVGRIVTLIGKFSATLTTTATETYIIFTLPFSQMANDHPAVGIVYHTLATASPGMGLITDNSPSDATTVALDIPAGQVTKANGTAFTASFTYVYESA